jgi:ER membrane protein complex subunit 3
MRIAADQMAQQMQQANPAASMNMFQPGQDPHKMFLAEAENLEVIGGTHEYVLDGVEERLLAKLS